MIINKAIIKHGYSNFTLEILEYCEPDKVIAREQHYLDLLSPEYNICRTAGSRLGRNHSSETKRIMSEARLGISLSKDTRRRMSAAKLGISLSEDTRRRMSAARKVSGAGSPCVQLEVLDLETDIKTIYDSMSEVSRALGICRASISKYLSRNQQKPYKKRYRFYYL
jgi:group I intron endonuclease